MTTPSVILVHGAWANGTSWSKTIPTLRARGLPVTAVHLPLISFADDVACVRRALAPAQGPVVLAGHSYGGAVITEAGLDDKVSGLVFVAAFAPDAGESAASLGQTVEPPPMAAELRPDDGYLRLTETGIREDFAQDLTPAEQDVLFAAQAPTAIASLSGSVSAPAWRQRPNWYLLASEDRALPPKLQRIMAGRMGAHIWEVASGHVAMLSHPEDVTRMIIEAVEVSTKA